MYLFASLFLQVTWIYIIQIASLLLVCLLQFFNSMIVGSLLVSFNMSTLLARRFQVCFKTYVFVLKVAENGT